MKVYITKWWEARGIVEHEGGEISGEAGPAAPCYYSAPKARIFLRIGTDAFYDWPAARARVGGLAEARVRALGERQDRIRKEWLA